MIIDSHTHFIVDKKKEGSFAKIKDELMLNIDKLGIKYSIVIPDNVSGSECADLNTVVEMTKDEKRLYMLGTLAVSDINRQTLSKINILFKNKIIRGFKIFPGHDPVYPTDKRWIPVFKLCLRYNFPLVVHTGINPGDKKCARYNDPKHIVKVAQKYPKLKIVLSHYFWPKLDYCFSITKGFKNIYFDTSALADPEVVRASGGIRKIREILVKTIKRDSESVIFGSDWPMCKTELHINLINSLGITKEEKNKVFYKNAKRVFKLS